MFEGVSWAIALREFRSHKGDLGWFEAFRRSKDPTTFTVLFEDSAALVGLLIALAGVARRTITRYRAFDGVASIAIGVVLAVSSLLLARETKGLLIGESAHPACARRHPAHRRRRSRHPLRQRRADRALGPDEVVAALSAEFRDALDTTRIEACVNRVEVAIKQRAPERVVLFIKPQTRQVWQERTGGSRHAPSDLP